MVYTLIKIPSLVMDYFLWTIHSLTNQQATYSSKQLCLKTLHKKPSKTN